jgi:hypothetical protein
MQLDDFRFDRFLAGEDFGSAAAAVSVDDLRRLTEDLYDRLDSLCRRVDDAGVVAIPEKGSGEEAWTFGHAVLHLTATCEEGAARASMLARGADASWRSRSEPDWRTLVTADAIRARVAESRRMVLAFFDTWPDVSHLEREVTPIPALGAVNAIGIHLLGLMHAAEHLRHLNQLMAR